MAKIPITTEVAKQGFLERFEDACHGVFHDANEGGYQYLPGNGPCEPLDELQEMIPDAEPKVLSEVAAWLTSNGSAWVKKGVY